MTAKRLLLTKDWVIDAGFEGDLNWAENVGAPTDSSDFAIEVAYVICNSGMQNRVARAIFDRVFDDLITFNFVYKSSFGHDGKRAAINQIWARRDELYLAMQHALASGPQVAVEWCGTLPWIGPVTKYHLAKNIGVDVAKPDVWLERVATWSGENVQSMCHRLSVETDTRIGTVDVIIWRACAERILFFSNGTLMPNRIQRMPDWKLADDS